MEAGDAGSTPPPPPGIGELAAEGPKEKRPWSKPRIIPLHRMARTNSGEFVQSHENEEPSYRPS